MTQGMNGVAPMNHDDKDTREIAQEALDVAHQANHRAMAASDHALDAHTRIGGLAGEMGRLSGSVDGLKMAMVTGFSDLGVKLKSTRTELGSTREKVDSIDEEIEITKVTNLKKIVKAYEQRTKWVAGILTAVLIAVLAAGLIHWFGWK